MSENMKAAVQAYLDNFNAQNAEGITALFADNATVEDPIGTPLKNGKDEILAFYKMAVKNGAQLAQKGQTRIAENMAAFAFEVTVGGAGMTDVDTEIKVELPPGSMTIHVIDTFAFNDDGKISEMRAFWGPSNIVQH